MRIGYTEAAALLKEAQDIGIFCHRSPDGDTLGSGYGLCLALRAMGKRARVICSDPIPRRYQYLAQLVEDMDFTPSFFVAVDTADAALLGRFSSFAQQVELCVDHHPSNAGYAKHLLLEEDSASTCELIYLLVQEMGVEISPAMAKCLYTGMATDTGCFRYGNTTARTHRLTAMLMEQGADFSKINKWLFETKTKEAMALQRMAQETMEYHFDNQCALVVITQKMLEDSGALEEDLEGISSLPRKVEGVRAGFALRQQKDGSYRVSLRTDSSINASQICQKLGGGGHPAAAGCTLSSDLEEAKQTMLEALSHEF